MFFKIKNNNITSMYKFTIIDKITSLSTQRKEEESALLVCLLINFWVKELFYELILSAIGADDSFIS